MTEEQACLRVGINHGSFRTAKHRNPQVDTAIKEAQAEFMDLSLDVIRKGARGWQGLAWILERRHGDQFRRNSGLEVSAQIGPFNPVDLLVRKPLNHWTAADFDQSLGAWLLLKKWPREQLVQLYDSYPNYWGLINDWTDEQLQWGAELEKCFNETGTEETSQPMVCEGSPGDPAQLACSSSY